MGILVDNSTWFETQVQDELSVVKKPKLSSKAKINDLDIFFLI